MRLFLCKLGQALARAGSPSRQITLTVIYGLAGGFAAVAFHLAIHWLYQSTFEQLAEKSPLTFALGSLAVIATTAAVSGWLLTVFCRDAAGSGIPQLKLAFWKDFGNVPWRVVWVKFIAGALSVGGGSSLGREGPSVHIGGGLASNVAGLLGEAKHARRASAAAGAAAGLAAAFNTPLAAVTFVLEELLEDLNSRLLGRTLLAAVVGALVVHAWIGEQPAFALGEIGEPSWRAYLLTPLAAAFAAAAGGLFQKLALDLRGAARSRPLLSSWTGPALGALGTWAVGCLVFFHTGQLGVFSLGYHDLSTALNGQMAWTIALELLAAKLLATVLCYGLGGCGGIFSPTLFFGGMSGAVIAGAAAWALPLNTADQMTLSIVGMVASLAAVVRAPVTGIVIVFEMTHELTLMPALMLGVLVSEAVARRMTHANFYETVLRQSGVELERVIPPRDLHRFQKLPASAVAQLAPVIVTRENFAETVAKYPYGRFPYVENGRLAGVLTRAAALRAAEAGGAPECEAAVTCLADEPISEIQSRILDSASHLVVLLDRPDGDVRGVITLHDLLRTQLALAEAPHT